MNNADLRDLWEERSVCISLSFRPRRSWSYGAPKHQLPAFRNWGAPKGQPRGYVCEQHFDLTKDGLASFIHLFTWNAGQSQRDTKQNETPYLASETCMACLYVMLGRAQNLSASRAWLEGCLFHLSAVWFSVTSQSSKSLGILIYKMGIIPPHFIEDALRKWRSGNCCENSKRRTSIQDSYTCASNTQGEGTQRAVKEQKKKVKVT